MIKILHISKYYYPYIGGTEQVARDIVNSLKGNNIEQKVICFNADASDGNIMCEKKQDVIDNVDDVEIYRCACQVKMASQSISLSYAKYLRKLMNDFEPDIVFFHYPNPYVAHYLLKYKKRDFKLIVYWHLDIIKQKVLGKLFYKQNYELLNRADKVVATSPNYIEGSDFLHRYKQKCIMIPNCINEKRLEVTHEINNEIKAIKDKYKNKIICFAVGRHVPYKGMEYLVKSSRLLDNNYCICIGGQGPLTEELKEEAKGDDKVVFLGRLSDEKLIAYYNACDIFCFPSITKNEAFGIALAEAMYFGKPAITFNIPGSGVNYVNLDGVTGIECENGNIEKYSDAIKNLATDKEKRALYGTKARKRVINNFTTEKFIVNIKNMIEKL